MNLYKYIVLLLTIVIVQSVLEECMQAAYIANDGHWKSIPRVVTCTINSVHFPVALYDSQRVMQCQFVAECPLAIYPMCNYTAPVASAPCCDRFLRHYEFCNRRLYYRMHLNISANIALASTSNPLMSIDVHTAYTLHSQRLDLDILADTYSIESLSNRILALEHWLRIRDAAAITQAWPVLVSRLTRALADKWQSRTAVPTLEAFKLTIPTTVVDLHATIEQFVHQWLGLQRNCWYHWNDHIIHRDRYTLEAQPPIDLSLTYMNESYTSYAWYWCALKLCSGTYYLLFWHYMYNAYKDMSTMRDSCTDIAFENESTAVIDINSI